MRLFAVPQNNRFKAAVFSPTLAAIAAIALLCTPGQAASTINTTLTVNATATAGVSGVTATGTAALTNIGNGTFTSTLSLSTFSGNYTITLSNGTITGVLTVSPAVLSGSGSASATVTGGSGTYAGSTGSFPNLNGSGSVGATGAITLTFTGPGTVTPGGGGGTPAPTITQVLNNYGLISAGFSNAGIAPNSIFIIKGSGLADPNAQAVLWSFSNGDLPTTQNGATVKVVDSKGTTVTPAFYYAIAQQLALVMPSNVATGPAQVTVTYSNQTSAAFTINIASSAMGFDAYYGAGTGLGVATNNLTGALYNYGSSIPPGTTVVLWGSGLGADPARDRSYTPAAFQINGLAHIYIGGVDANIGYQGASGFPGLNQVNVTVPINAPTGCNVSLVGVTAGGVPTNFLTLPIGTGACSDPQFGTDGSQFQKLSGQATVKSGAVLLFHSTSPGAGGAPTVIDAASASFQSVTGSAFGSANGSVSSGGCVLSQTISGSGGSTGTVTGLDAGTVTVTPPGGGAATALSQLPTVPGTYIAQLASGFIPAAGGAFPFKGSGGKDVGSFSTSVNLTNPLTWTNQAADATVTRSAGLPVTWSGGAAGTFVTISGTSTSTSPALSASFTCIVPVALGTFTVPNYVLGGMPAGNGSVNVSNNTNYQTFSATGLDIGIAFGFVQTSINSVYQ